MDDDATTLNKVKDLLNNYFPNGRINRHIISMTNVKLYQHIKEIKKLLFGLERIKKRSVDVNQRDYASDLLDNLNKLYNSLELIYRTRMASPQAPSQSLQPPPQEAPVQQAPQQANEPDNSDLVVYGGIKYKKSKRNKRSRRYKTRSRRHKMRSRIYRKHKKRSRRT
jgi:hypothetical protein